MKLFELKSNGTKGYSRGAGVSLSEGIVFAKGNWLRRQLPWASANSDYLCATGR